MEMKLVLAIVVFAILSGVPQRNIVQKPLEEGLYTGGDEYVTFKLQILPCSNYELSINALTNCFSRGNYKILKDNSICLKHNIVFEDSAKLFIYEVNKCILDDSKIRIVNKSTISFDNYTLNLTKAFKPSVLESKNKSIEKQKRKESK